MKNNIVSRIEQIQRRILNACQKAQRDPHTVKLLMATKTVDPDRIKIALSTGQTLIAENRIQELKEKYTALADTPHISHFIGHLQTNKINDLIRYEVSCLHSLDRLELIQKLQSRLEVQNRTMQALLQVNTSQEASKFGCHPDEVPALIQAVLSCPRIELKGFMTIGANSTDESTVRACFQLLKHLQTQSQEQFQIALPELSMGMSHDLEWAIEEGATIIRVGSAIFGERIYTPTTS